MSNDDHRKQCEFATSVGANFPMIGDSGHRVSKAFGVLWPLIGVSRRVTFIIDSEGIIRSVFRDERHATKHVDEALAALERLAPAR